MPASKKYSDDFRRQAVRMVAEISGEGVDQSDAIDRVADLLSVPTKLLRQWVDQEIDREGDQGKPQSQPFDPTAIDDPYEAGVQLVEFGALDEAQSMWGAAAEAGDTEAAFNLGVLLVRRGQLVAKSRRRRRLGRRRRAGHAAGAARGTQGIGGVVASRR